MFFFRNCAYITFSGNICSPIAPLNVLHIAGDPDFHRVNDIHRPHDYPVEVGDMLNISINIINHFQKF